MKMAPQFNVVQTKTLSLEEVQRKMTAQMFDMLEGMKKDLKAVRYVLPRENTLETVKFERGAPYTVTFYGATGERRSFMFENSTYSNEVLYIKEVFLEKTEMNLEPMAIEEEAAAEETEEAETAEKGMEDIAKEWWISVKARLIEEINQTAGMANISLGKDWAIPDPDILPFVSKYLSELTKDAFVFDSIDDDCNGLIISKVDEKTEEAEKKAKAESRAEKFAKRQAKAKSVA